MVTNGDVARSGNIPSQERAICPNVSASQNPVADPPSLGSPVLRNLAAVVPFLRSLVAVVRSLRNRVPRNPVAVGLSLRNLVLTVVQFRRSLDPTSLAVVVPIPRNLAQLADATGNPGLANLNGYLAPRSAIAEPSTILRLSW